MPAHSVSEPKCKYCGTTLDWNEGIFGRVCDECLRKLEDEEQERREDQRHTIDDDFDDSDVDPPRTDDKPPSAAAR